MQTNQWMNEEWMKIYIAHISSQFCFECSRRLADVLAISSGCLTHERDQRYAATGARSTVFNHIEIHACWVFWCLCNPPNSDMDYRIFIVRAWSSACVHTLDLGFESHPKDYVPSILTRARCHAKPFAFQCRSRVSNPRSLLLVDSSSGNNSSES